MQSPLPEQIDEALVTNYIRPEKDVDAFHPFNVGRIMLGDYTYLPCTPAGIMEICGNTALTRLASTVSSSGAATLSGAPCRCSCSMPMPR